MAVRPRVSGLVSLSVLELVREIAADAAAQSDPDACLRLLRAGLIRLGFARAGVFVTDPRNPAIFRGTWGTDWDGSETDEHHVIDAPTPETLSWKILTGERVASDRIARPSLPDSPSHAWISEIGEPNHACVA